MATSQGQDVIRCHLCEKSVEFHCNLCNTGLCGNCVLKHMSDKSRKHEVVEFKDRKENLVYPECKSHGSKCETYCHGCKLPVCIKCVITLHKDHEVAELDRIVTRQKDAIESDRKKLSEKVKHLQMHEENTAISDEEFDKVTSDITQREKEIQGMVRNVAEKMRKEVAKKKEQNIAVNADNESKISDVKRKLQRAIESKGELLRSQNVQDFLNYRDTSADLTTNITLADNPNPSLTCKRIQEEQIQGLFGNLSFQDKVKIRGLFGNLSFDEKVKHLIDTPEVMATIPSHQYPLWRLICAGNDKIWTSGIGSAVKQIDRHGNVLLSVTIEVKPISLSVDGQQCLVFSQWYSSDVNVYKNGSVQTCLSITNWIVRGLCHTKDGELVVSFRSSDKKQSKVVRFSGTTERQTIQYDEQGQPLFSTVLNSVLLLTENGNGDICVADFDGKEVVVVKASGGLRFKYQGNLSKQSKYTTFEPYSIATDINHQILISDKRNNVVHVIDRDGNFIRYIEYPCNGGLSIDADHNLVVGDETSGKIRIIKYLQ